MPDINKPMDVPELNLQPPITGKVKLSPDMQQTLALLCTQGNAQRVLLKSSASGVLNVTEPRITHIIHYTGVGANNTQKGSNIPCSECLIMGHPDNTGTVWVRPDKLAMTYNSWPLAAWDVVKFALDNLQELNMRMVIDGDKIIVAYTR